MNNHRLCSQRDRDIEGALVDWKALDLYQIAHMFFPSLRTTRRRMTQLVEMKKVNRVRVSVDLPYFYYIGKRPAQIEHRIGTNYVRLFLGRWEAIRSWEYEPAYYDFVRPDGFCGAQDGFYFVEFDRGFDPFNKVEIYNDLRSSGKYRSAWWVKQAKRFPVVMVVTCDEGRKRAIEQQTKSSEVEFRVYLYEKVKEAVQNG